MSLQPTFQYPASQTHEPPLCAAPWPEHVVASENWHELPAEPASQTHEPSVCAAPSPEHVVASECWHELPAEPAGHAVSQLEVE